MTALAVVEPTTNLPAQIDGLIDWVTSATAEDVCWRITEIGSMRQWLQAQKEATELRIRAVRLEFIALRKVALGGLVAKIGGAPQLRSSAQWLASLTDDEFSALLSEIDGDKSPIALYRADKAQRDAMAASMSRSSDHSEWQHRATYDRYRRPDGAMRSAATALLSELLEAGEPFTVSQAAERLASRLELDVDVREETADGLREMVRSAIRHGEHAVDTGWGILPVAFTYMQADGVYVRVPAGRATFGHLVAHEREVRDRAEATLRQADALRLMVEEGYSRLGIVPAEVSLNVDPEHADLDSLLSTPLSEIVGVSA